MIAHRVFNCHPDACSQAPPIVARMAQWSNVLCPPLAQWERLTLSLPPSFLLRFILCRSLRLYTVHCKIPEIYIICKYAVSGTVLLSIYFRIWILHEIRISSFYRILVSGIWSKRNILEHIVNIFQINIKFIIYIIYIIHLFQSLSFWLVHKKSHKQHWSICREHCSISAQATSRPFLFNQLEHVQGAHCSLRCPSSAPEKSLEMHSMCFCIDMEV